MGWAAWFRELIQSLGFLCLIALPSPGVWPLFTGLKLTHQHHPCSSSEEGDRKLRTHHFLVRKVVKMLTYHVSSHFLGENFVPWPNLLAEK